MKSLLCLLNAVFDDVEHHFGANLLDRDRKTITDRVNDEGISFLTITLPNFHDWILSSIENGRFLNTGFSSFKRRPRSSLPAFLHGLTSRIFDSVSADLLTNPSEDALLYIRQICLMFKKISLPCSDARVEKAFQKYWSLEHELRHSKDNTKYYPLFDAVSRLVWADVMSSILRNTKTTTPVGAIDSIVPFHSSGATADHKIGNSRFHVRQWYTRLQRVFPADWYAIPNLNWDVQDLQFLHPEEEIPVKVISVPKSLKTPRIIAEEPSFLLSLQQGIRLVLCEAIESAPITMCSVHFRSQEHNRRAAMSGSIDKRLATLDLSDASDRVSNQLVRRSMRSVPELRAAIQAARTTRAEVNLKQGRRQLSLTKFASMGSALCFPIEAMMFYIITLVAWHDATNTRPTFASCKRASTDILVYGDDIVVPCEIAPRVKDALEAFRLKVNSSKSFSNSKFRESCGCDAFAGTDVTPVYLRSIPSFSPRDGVSFVSTVEFANQLYEHGFWTAAEFCFNTIAAHYRPLPYGSKEASCVCRTSFLFQYEANTWLRNLHCLGVRGLTTKATLPKSKATAQGALMKHFLKRGNLPFQDTRHLERYGRPLDVKLYPRKVVAR